MSISVLDASTLGDDLSFDELFALGKTTIYQTTDVNEVENHIGDSDTIIVNKIKLNESNLKTASNLKLICVAATGYDNIDIDYCRQNGIAVCNVVAYSTHSVAQVTVAMALSLSTNLTEFSQFVNTSDYSNSGIANRLTPVYHELAGKIWGIIGMGNIGKQVAKIATALGCQVVGYRRNPDKDYTYLSLEELCKTSDIISVHLPLSDDTHGLINGDIISLMKKNAIFINVARGAITDEEALANALINGKISGLGIDVYSVEPFPPSHPFQKLLGNPRVCLTPHMAWGAFESRKRCLDEIILNIKAFYSGQIRNRLDI